MMSEYGTIPIDEHHPAADSAFVYVTDYLHRIGGTNTLVLVESFASSALSGNKTAEYCSETLRRVLCGEGVSDRYLLGLAWTLKQMEEL